MRTKRFISITAFVVFSLLFCTSVFAQEDRTEGTVRSYLKGLEYEVKAGYNIGGTSPLPIPEQIQSLISYNPGLGAMLGTEVTKWFNEDKKLGFIVSLRLENKVMETDANVMKYKMKITGADYSSIEGPWTGNVHTSISNSFVSIPILLAYKVSPRWKLKLGGYASYLLTGDFSGYVYEGYLRVGNSLGQKIEFTGDAKADYSFSDDLRKFYGGAQLGAEWRALKRLNVNADITWGLSGIFPKDFETVTFAMYPIYATLGFGYTF